MKELILRKTIYGICVFVLLFQGCQTQTVNPQTDQVTGLKNAVADLLREWYLWNDQVPTTINTSQYSTADDLLSALKYKDDKWSYIDDLATYNAYYNSGQYAGHGFGLKFDAGNNLKVSLVYPDGPAGRAGFTRGCTILKINGKTTQEIGASNITSALGASTVGVQNTFQYKDINGNTMEVSLGKENVSINSVLTTKIFTVNGKKVGYMVFNTFIENSKAELNTAIASFAAAGVQDCILDLRYNGGGLVKIAQYLSGLLAPSSAVGKQFITFSHNTIKTGQNATTNVDAASYNLNLSRLIVITSQSTASASELVINGLRPYMQMILIGDKTYGKPVGSYGFTYSDKVISLISFRTINAQGIADYYNGFPVNSSKTDDLTRLFGDENEICLAEALNYIKTGTFTGSNARVENSNNRLILPEKGLKSEMGVF